ncbi:MAG TPA: efflux RND transporter permease subunit, partial [Pirellulaceae bacterium]|nr:efflux RND transporter permease subunit [Pirellulaceae bacterium]
MRLRRIILLVGGLLLASAGVVLGMFFFSSTQRTVSPPPTIIVQAFYPGANAPTVAETVAAPIEQQVNGVEQMVSLSSRSVSDGSYTLRIEFKPGTDLDTAQRLVQERVSLASSLLPEVVQREGITIRKKLLEPLMLLSLTSPDGRYDELYLSNYASLRVKDELARLPGVGDVVLFGEQHLQMRIAIDGNKLAAHQLAVAEVVKALHDQEIQIAPVAMRDRKSVESNKFVLFCRTSGNTEDSRTLHGIVLPATTTDGQVVRLVDVASIELDRSIVSGASINGEPGVLLGIQPSPQASPTEVSRVVLEKWEELRATAPEELAHEVALDFTPQLAGRTNSATPEYLVVDVPNSADIGAGQLTQLLIRPARQVRELPGLTNVIALTRHPFTLVQNQPCFLIAFTAQNHRKASREQLASQVRLAIDDSNLPPCRILVNEPADLP